MRNFVASVPSELAQLYPELEAAAIDREGRALDDELAKRVSPHAQPNAAWGRHPHHMCMLSTAT